jgi:hypothetical protein
VSSSVEEVLGEAARLEKEYEWLKASELYEQALSGVDEGDFFRRGEVQEKIGRALHRAAFQAESRDVFLEKIQQSIMAYAKAEELFDKSKYEHKEAWMLRCNAIAKYLEFWLTSDPGERRSYLKESFDLEEKALDYLLIVGENIGFCKTVNELSYVPLYISYIEWDRKISRDSLEKGISWAEKAIQISKEKDDYYELARSYVTLARNLNWFRVFFEEDLVTQRGILQKNIEYVKMSIDAAKKIGDALALGTAYSARIARNIHTEHFREALKYGEETGDIFLKANALQGIAYSLYWTAYVLEDPDERLKLAKDAMEYYDNAQSLFAITNFQLQITGKLGAQTPGGYVEYYWDRARWETDFNKKRELLEKSENAGIEAIKITEKSDIPNFVGRVYHVFSAALSARARLESDIKLKESYLLRALDYRKKNIEIMNQLIPYHYWNQGVYYNLLALTQQELASIQPEHSSKISLLEDAVDSAKTSLEFIYKEVPFWTSENENWVPFCRYQSEYAAILKNLYNITNNHENLREAIRIWHEAIQAASKLNQVTHIAEFYWEIAKAQVVLGEHIEAAENFKLSSENYEYAVVKIPQLKEFYKDYALYMRAWSEFERAKQSHAEKRYMQAKEHYEKAAELHSSTERWNYLASNYQAWARLDEAEDLSRREQTEEARSLFRQANGLFEEAKGTIEIKLTTVQDEEEKRLLVSLTQASDIRRDYCLGRIALEEGRILDRQGDHLASSRRYGSAAETFQRIAGTSEEAQMELQPLVYLCKAWQKMTQAEARTSPELYSEASKLFEEAREHSQDERSKRLALGHSRFCKALETGTRFEDTRDFTLYSEAIQHLGSAASHYLRAGFESAAEYAGATQRLFDGYIYMDNAQKEVDPQKRAKFYTMAERVLETSAGSYLMAKHPEKSEEVQRLLRRVREERELAATLSEVLHAPTTVSTTEAFTAPMPTREKAVGLEKFESADIQANFVARRREVGVGEDLDLEIELVNAGKAPAQLVKVEDIVIEGFELKSYPEICRVEDSYLDMKGRTLSPLKTQELKLVLKPLTKGSFELKPRILYLDEAGKYKSHEPDPVSITVQELGIRGWLRGPTR